MIQFKSTLKILAALGVSSALYAQEIRKSEHAIDSSFIKRQSKRDLFRMMSSEELKEKLMLCFEAARWAPSASNGQPWRFVYGVHGTKAWDRLFDLLKPGNKGWAQNSGALVAVVSSDTSHSFETGMATANFLIQATKLDLVTHPMGGFDRERAKKELNIPAQHVVDAIIAIGETAPSKHSKAEFSERDAKPSQRKTLSEIVFEGELPAS